MKDFSKNFRKRLLTYIAVLGLVAGAAWVQQTQLSQPSSAHSALAK